ncbi:MAG: flavin reductase family protein [Candidatus Eiseniibacteriota bacterium]
MIVDPAGIAANAMYRLMTEVVVPRPIAFVSTRSAAGQMNLAPFSYFNAVSSAPPLISISFSERADDPKDTLRNIRETGDFVVNLVSEPLLGAMAKTAGEWPRTTDEFEVAGLAPESARRVQAPRVAQSPVHLECRLHREIPLGNGVLVVGEIVLVEISDDVLTDGRVDPLKLRPVGRLSGELYSLMREVVKTPRPRVSRTTGEPVP